MLHMIYNQKASMKTFPKGYLRLLVITLSLVLFCMTAESNANPPGFVQLDDPGHGQTEAHGINNEGDIVGGSQLNPPGVGGPVSSFFYSGGGFQNFDMPPTV